MTITPVGSGVPVNSDFSVTARPGLPTGVQPNDLLVCFTGFTSQTGTVNSNWSTLVRNDSTSMKQLVSYKIAATGEVEPSITTTNGVSGQRHASCVVAFRGASLATPFGTPVVTAHGAQANIGPLSPATASGTHGAVLVFGQKLGEGSVWTSVAPLSGDGLSWVEMFDFPSASGSDQNIVGDYAIWTGTTPTLTAKTFIVTGGTSGAGGGGTMVTINPAPTGGNVSYVGVGTPSYGLANAVLSPTLPSGVTSGDFLFAVGYLRNAGTLNISSGWTQHSLVDTDINGTSFYLRTWYKFAGASAQSATDAFTGTNGTSLSSYSANWVANGTASSIAISANGITSTIADSAENAYHRSETAYNANQYAQVSFVTKNAVGTYIGPAVRVAAGSTKTYYGYYAEPGETQVFKSVAGVWTQLGSSIPSSATLMRLEANGSTISAIGDGITILSVTDTSITSGYPGLAQWSNTASSGNIWDNWQAGDLSGDAAPTITPLGGTTSPETLTTAFVVGFRGISTTDAFTPDGTDSFAPVAGNVGPIAAATGLADVGAVMVFGIRNGTHWDSVATLTGDNLIWVEAFDNFFNVQTVHTGIVMDYAIWGSGAPTLTAKTFVPTGGAGAPNMGKMFALRGGTSSTFKSATTSLSTSVAVLGSVSVSMDTVVQGTLLNVGTASVGDHTSSLIPGLPPGIVAGDLLVAFGYLRNNGTLSIAGESQSLSTPVPSENVYDSLILQYCQQHGHPRPRIIKAQIKVESNFNVFAISDDTPFGIFPEWTSEESRSFGLLQITPAGGEIDCDNSADGRMLLEDGHPNMTTDSLDPLWLGSVFNPELNIDATIKLIMKRYDALRTSYPTCPIDTLALMAAAAWADSIDTVTACGVWTTQIQINYVNAINSAYTNWWGGTSGGAWTEHSLTDATQFSTRFYLKTWYSVYDGTQIDPTIVVSGGSTTPQTVSAAFVLSARNVNAGAPFGVDGPDSFNDISVNVGPISPPTSLPSAGTALVIGVRNAGVWSSVTPLSGDGLTWLEMFDNITNTVAGLGISIVLDYVRWTTGAPQITAKTFTPTGGGGGTGMGKMFVLNLSPSTANTVSVFGNCVVSRETSRTCFLDASVNLNQFSVATNLDALIDVPGTLVRLVSTDAAVKRTQLTSCFLNANVVLGGSAITASLDANVAFSLVTVGSTLTFLDTVVNPPLVLPDAPLTATGEMSRESTDTAWLVLLTLDHEDLTDSIRVTSDAVSTASGGDVYSPFPFEVILPDDVEGVPPQAQLRIDNTTQEIISALRGLTSPPRLTIKIVRSINPDIVDYSWTGLEWSASSYDKSIITGTLTFNDLSREEFPYTTFDTRWSGLWP